MMPVAYDSGRQVDVQIVSSLCQIALCPLVINWGQIDNDGRKESTMNKVYALLCQRANGQTEYLARNADLLCAELPESGLSLESLAKTGFVPHMNWEAAACAYELAGDAWEHLEQRVNAAQDYGQAAVYYALAGCRTKALEMRAMANDVQDTLYL